MGSPYSTLSHIRLLYNDSAGSPAVCVDLALLITNCLGAAEQAPALLVAVALQALHALVGLPFCNTRIVHIRHCGMALTTMLEIRLREVIWTGARLQRIPSTSAEQLGNAHDCASGM